MTHPNPAIHALAEWITRVRPDEADRTTTMLGIIMGLHIARAAPEYAMALLVWIEGDPASPGKPPDNGERIRIWAAEHPLATVTA